LNDELTVAVRASHEQSFGQIEFEILTAIDAPAQIGLAVLQFARQIDIDRLLTEWAFVRFKHNGRALRCP